MTSAFVVDSSASRVGPGFVIRRRPAGRRICTFPTAAPLQPRTASPAGLPYEKIDSKMLVSALFVVAARSFSRVAPYPGPSNTSKRNLPPHFLRCRREGCDRWYWPDLSPDMGQLSGGQGANRVTYQNVTLVRYATQEHRPSHDLDDGAARNGNRPSHGLDGGALKHGIVTGQVTV